MKKIAIILTMLLALSFGAGCYTVKAAKLNDILGTYELTNYNRTGRDAVNYKERDEIMCYLVLESSSSALYIYKDKYTPLSVTKIKVRLEPSREEPNKYEYVCLKLNDATDEIRLGYVKGLLNSTTFKHHGTILDNNLQFNDDFQFNAAQINTDYQRKSKDTDLSYVEEQLGDLPEIMPYNTGLYDGVYIHSFYRYNYNNEYDIITENYDEPFVYAFLDVSVFTNSATVYYMLKADEVAKEETYSASLVQSGDGYFIKIGDESFETEMSYSSMYMYFPSSVQYGEGQTLDFDLSFTRQERAYAGIEQRIQDAIEIYERDKQETNEEESITE